MLSKIAIEEFRTIYRKEYGREISYSEAMRQANNLIRLYKNILPTLKNETYKTKN